MSSPSYYASILCKYLLIIGVVATFFIVVFFNLTYISSQYVDSNIFTIKCEETGPKETTTNLSHLMFVLVGSSSAWKHRRTYIESWWRPNVTQIQLPWFSNSNRAPRCRHKRPSHLRLAARDRNAADIAEESFTTEEFNRNILRPREGKPPLLAGDLTVTLEDGVGVVSGDVTFTENSSWTRCRLGAKVRQQGGVVEAISRAFVCRDRPRGECE
ncbi:hypothetical protein YC2023_123906 [Brassica napus]